MFGLPVDAPALGKSEKEKKYSVNAQKTDVNKHNYGLVTALVVCLVHSFSIMQSLELFQCASLLREFCVTSRDRMPKREEETRHSRVGEKLSKTSFGKRDLATFSFHRCTLPIRICLPCRSDGSIVNIGLLAFFSSSLVPRAWLPVVLVCPKCYTSPDSWS